MDHFRTEHDTLGAVFVPAAACYGAQTQRSVGIFPVSGAQKLSAYPQLIEAMLHVKRAAARTNVAIGALPERRRSSDQRGH